MINPDRHKLIKQMAAEIRDSSISKLANYIWIIDGSVQDDHEKERNWKEAEWILFEDLDAILNKIKETKRKQIGRSPIGSPIDCPCGGSGKIYDGGYSVYFCDYHSLSPFD